jgi:hypothetical protein
LLRHAGNAELFVVTKHFGLVRMDWFISNLLGGIKLAVKEDDVAVDN